MRMVNRHSPDKIMNNKTKTGIEVRDVPILVFNNAYIKIYSTSTTALM